MWFEVAWLVSLACCPSAQTHFKLLSVYLRQVGTFTPSVIIPHRCVQTAVGVGDSGGPQGCGVEVGGAVGKQQGHSQSHQGARSIVGVVHRWGSQGVVKEAWQRRSRQGRRGAGFPEGDNHTCEDWQT